MLKKVDLQIIEFLSKSQNPVSGDEIAQVLLLSKKTALKRINECAEIIQSHGAAIRMKKGVGFWLEVHDPTLLDKIFQRNNLTEVNDLQSEDFLIKELCLRLITSSDYQKSDDLADELFISRSKLTLLLNELRSIIRNYDLELKSKPYHGLKIIGTEFNMRRFIASNYIQHYALQNHNKDVKNMFTSEQDFGDKKSEIEQIVQNVLDAKEVRMPNNIFDNLVLHLTITLLRYQMGMSVDMIQDIEVSEEDALQINMTKEVLKTMEEKYGVQFTEGEYQYILVHFLSKKEMDLGVTVIPTKINQMIDCILNRINEEKSIDLRGDFDLRSMLGLHLVPLIDRIHYHIQLKNPLLEEIKIRCILGYDCAIICAAIINEEYQTVLSENEVSYFALHFDVALNRKIELVTKKNVLVVCASGRASAMLLKIRFEQFFSKYLDEIYVCDVKEAESFLEKIRVDYIFTTVFFETRRAIPVFDFDFFLNQQSIKKIQNVLDGENKLESLIQLLDKRLFFANQIWSSKKEVLHEMSKKIHDVIQVSNEFEELLFQREVQYGTDLFDMVALPHPNQAISDETFLSIATLEKPIIWKTRKVRLICLVSISKHESEKYKFIFEILINLFSSQTAIAKIIQEGNYQTLINELTRLEWRN